MFVDGKIIQERIKSEIEASGVKAVLDIVYIGDDPVIDKYISLKESFGKTVDIIVRIHRHARINEHEMQELLQDLNAQSDNGIIVQLPVPHYLDRTKILNYIDPDKDIDVLSQEAYKRFVSGKLPWLPPVAGAVAEICKEYNVDLSGKSVAVVGHGRLVGQPVADWLRSQGVEPVIFEKNDPLNLQTFDVVISGVGEAGLITPDLVKDNVVLLDAGTSTEEGGIVGDISLECQTKASLFAGVPGGIGPITLATLFANLVKAQQF